MLDERIRTHIDTSAAPVALDEVLARCADDEDLDVVQSDPQSLAPARPLLELDRQVAEGSRSVLVAAAAILFVLAAGGLLTAAIRAEPPTLLAEEVTGVELQQLPAGLAEAVWRKIDEPFAPVDDGNAVRVTSAMSVEGVAWAAGFEGRIDFENDRIDARKRGAIWRSTDGETWTAVDADFGSLESPGGNWAPSGIAFDHIVATKDRSIWAIGNEFRDTIRPVATRSTDGGQSWEWVDVPAVGEQSNLIDVSVSGNTVVAVIVDDGLSPNEQTRVISTTGDGWDAVLEMPGSTSQGFAAMAVDDGIVSVTNRLLPGKTNGSLDLIGGPGLFVAAGLDPEPPNEAVEGEVPERHEGLLWTSVDATNWSLVQRDVPLTRSEMGTRLLRHNDGVLTATEWFDENAAGVSLGTIDATSRRYQPLGEVPSATLRAMFVLDGKLFVIGSQDSARFDEYAEEDDSLWVAEQRTRTEQRERDESDEAEVAATLQRCLDVLETPDQGVLTVVTSTEGRINVEPNITALDPRVRLCRDAVNEEIVLGQTGSSEGRSGPHSPEQVEALTDGVTEDEYEQGWDRFEACFERGGGEVTREGFGGAMTSTWPASARFLNDVCYSWHFERIDSYWQNTEENLERAATRQRVSTAAGQAWSAIGEAGRDLPLTNLLVDPKAHECQTAWGDRAWITTFESMPQPLCFVVGEDHDVDFWNKGFETVSVAWPDGVRTLRSDEHFQTGRLGEIFAVGEHSITVHPYGAVTFYVIPERLSFTKALNDVAPMLLDSEVGIRGLSSTELGELLGVEFSVVEPPSANLCFAAQMARDPYSPKFLFVGDGMDGDNSFVGLGSDDFVC